MDVSGFYFFDFLTLKKVFKLSFNDASLTNYFAEFFFYF